jgi:ferredoxin
VVSTPPAGWRLEVDRDRCIGSGMCAGMAPDHFTLVDGVSVPSAGPVPPDDAVIDAAESCPVEAITVRDAADGRLVAPEA